MKYNYVSDKNLNLYHSKLKEYIDKTMQDLSYLAYGIEWDVTVADPVCTRIGNILLHKQLPIQSALRGCICQGKEIKYYLNPNNWNLYIDGDPQVQVQSVTDITENSLTITATSNDFLVNNKVLIKHDSYSVIGYITSITGTSFSISIESHEGTIVDGTPTMFKLPRLDGYEGTVQIECPKFYIWSESDGNKRRVWISLHKLVPYAQENPHMLMDAYKSTILNTVPENMGYLSTLPVNSPISVVNTSTYCRGGNDASYDQYLETDKFRTGLGKPKTSITRATFRTYADKVNREPLNYVYYKNIFCWLYYIEYANFNVNAPFKSDLTSDGFRQGGLGSGVIQFNGWDTYGYQPLTPCGYCNEFGNFTNIKQMTIPKTIVGDKVVNQQTFNVPRWRGYDNIFGDLWTNLDGVIIFQEKVGDTKKLVYTCTQKSKYGDTLESVKNMTLTGYQIRQDGWIREFDIQDTAEIIPSKVSTNSNAFVSDYNWNGSDNTSLRALLVGGAAWDGSSTGLSAFTSYDGVSISALNVGLRSLIILD